MGPRVKKLLDEVPRRKNSKPMFLNPGTRIRYEDAVSSFDGKYFIEIDCRVQVGDFSGTRPTQGQCKCGRGCDKK